MAKIVKNSFGNFLVIFVIFSLIFSWFYSGWPRIWQKPAIPPEIQEAGAAKVSWSTATNTVPWVVPTGVTSITVKSWGGGAGGGGGGGIANGVGGGAGGGGGFASSTINVSPSETLTVMVGGGGGGGAGVSDIDGGGGGGGGYSAVKRSATILIQAGGGGGGGAGSGPSETGGAGGAGGGLNGVNGSIGADATCIAGGVGDFGDGGSQSGGGAGGSGCSASADGTGGSANTGGAGGAGGATTAGGTGGLNGGAAGGGGATTNAGGGGGGGGAYGGGGGEAAVAEGAGGAGGGSATSTGTGIHLAAGSNQTPGNSTDSDRSTYCSTAGNGGAGGAKRATGSAGNAGCVVIIYNTAPSFTAGPTDDPYDPVNQGNDVVFSATSTDADSDNWYLAVCKTNSVTAAIPPTCATDQTYCVSSATSTSGSLNTCNWTSTGSGEQIWYGFACDDSSLQARCSSVASSTITVNVASVTCTTPLTQTTFTLLTNTYVATSTPDATTTVSCTGCTNGFTIQVSDKGNGPSNPGLWNSSDSVLIGSADAELSAGIGGYGIQATTTAGNGININPKFLWATSTNIVGGLTASSTWVTLASSTGAVTNQIITVSHKAAVSVTTKTGSYSDTIYYQCFINSP